MSRYHITVLQLLRTKLVCSHSFLFKSVCCHSFLLFSSKIIFCFPDFSVNFEFNPKTGIGNRMQQILRKQSAILREKKGENGKKEKKNLSSEYHIYFYRLKRVRLVCSMDKQFLTRKLSQYCRGSFVFSTASVIAKLCTHERKKQFPTPALTNYFLVQFEFSLRAYFNQRLRTLSNSHLNLFTASYTHLVFPKTAILPVDVFRCLSPWLPFTDQKCISSLNTP